MDAHRLGARRLGLVGPDRRGHPAPEGEGPVEGKANFFLSFRTSRQVPEFVVGLLLPKEIQAQPA